MIITGMKHFESVCQKKLVEWYNKNRPETPIDLRGCIFIVLELQNSPETNVWHLPQYPEMESMRSIPLMGTSREPQRGTYTKSLDLPHRGIGRGNICSQK